MRLTKVTVSRECLGDEELRMIIERMRSSRGWDFSGYKESSLKRRIMKRINALSMSARDYCALLEKDPSESDILFSTITIKVSEFFREPEIFEYLKDQALPSFAGKESLRVWSCGCAFGEESYSIAIMLSECLPEDVLRKTKVFATDIDAEALDIARKARYREESIRNVSPELREKYFFQDQGLHKVKYNIRNLVKFGALDIVASPSLSKLDIIFCRNVFIYFNKQLQEKAFEKLDYALNPGGYIVLGKAEVMPQAFLGRYAQPAGKTGIYRKNP